MDGESNQDVPRSAVKGWVRPLLIVIPYLLCMGLFQHVCLKMMGLGPENHFRVLTPFQSLCVSVATLFATLLIVFVFKICVDKENLAGLGFRNRHVIRDLAFGLVTGALVIVAGFFILLFFKQIEVSGTGFDGLHLVYCILLFIAVSVSEEIMLRGYVLSNLMLSLNRWLALIISALFFAFLHISNSNFSWTGFVNIGLAGIMLGMPFVYTRNLWYSFALHFSWNFMQGTIFGFNVSGHETYSIVNQSSVAGNIWNGGKFGFEGSVVCVILQVLSLVAIWWYFHRKEKRFFYPHPAIPCNAGKSTSKTINRSLSA